ncbi:uncharacterized protein B0J16DRAFT_45236 [Fusarium flagelliforme]|uniref:uncharacterized protein n=1 Tax=Fusarium flagelliforme TaxID=2675880 RepID=UPI001E8E3D1C|nr:uncharacterized protein B0J16DRAFT_45236 [Fusarium flagelliforme]KAH7198747.1 hypothetical protein B0J16DRAFT_45236 [Fusarium flagelliforme]
MAPSTCPNSDKVKKRPKVRGCYQCSRRRIDCDRKEPGCAKCADKGIKCSGLGLRYRFNDGIAARGRFVGKTVPVVDKPAKKTAKSNDASTASQGKRQITDPVVTKDDAKTAKIKGPCFVGDSDFGLYSDVRDPFRQSGYEYTTQEYDTTLDYDTALDYEVDETVEDVVETRDLAVSYHEPLSVIWGLDHVDPKSRFCLGYFSNNIAQLIAVINMGFNGYRDLVLPRAETDPLVRKAVLLVVEQHLSLQHGTSVSLDPSAYGSIVRELISRSHQCAPQDDDSALTALLLLHIREMISGSDNFKLIYGSLRVVVNALAAKGDGKTSDLRRFLQMQILRYVLPAGDKFHTDIRQSLSLWRIPFQRNKRRSLHPSPAKSLSRIHNMVRKRPSRTKTPPLPTRKPNNPRLRHLRPTRHLQPTTRSNCPPDRRIQTIPERDRRIRRYRRTAFTCVAVFYHRSGKFDGGS